MSNIDPVQSKLTLRRNRPNASGGIAYHAQTAEDLRMLQVELERTLLTKFLDGSIHRKRSPEITLFGVDSRLPDDKIKEAVLK